MVDRLKLTHLYTVPTVIKFLMKAGDDHVGKYNLSSLRVIALGKTGVCYNSQVIGSFSMVPLKSKTEINSLLEIT